MRENVKIFGVYENNSYVSLALPHQQGQTNPDWSLQQSQQTLIPVPPFTNMDK